MYFIIYQKTAENVVISVEKEAFFKTAEERSKLGVLPPVFCLPVRRIIDIIRPIEYNVDGALYEKEGSYYGIHDSKPSRT